MSIFAAFNVYEDLKRYGNNLLSNDAEKSLRNFTILIIICVFIDSLYLAFISYLAVGIQIRSNSVLQATIAAGTFVVFLYMFVSVDKSIVTSDLFSEEKIRRVKYKDIDFSGNRTLNRLLNTVFYSLYLLTSPVKAILSANPAAAFILTIRVVFMVCVHVCVLIFVFLFTSDQVGEAVGQENKIAVQKISSWIDKTNNSMMANDSVLTSLRADRTAIAGHRDSEAKGLYRKDSSGPGTYFKSYEAQLVSLDKKISDREAVVKETLLKKVKIVDIDFRSPKKNPTLVEHAAMSGIDLKEDSVTTRAANVFAGIRQNPVDFIAKMVPTLGMSMLLIAPLFILILMKAFQNRSLRHYYDIELQEHYSYYNSGIYNWLLSDKVKQPTGTTKISVVVFSDIYYEVIRKFTKNISRARLSLLQKEIDILSVRLIETNQVLDVSTRHFRSCQSELSSTKTARSAATGLFERLASDVQSSSAVEGILIKVQALDKRVHELELELSECEAKQSKLVAENQLTEAEIKKHQNWIKAWLDKDGSGGETMKLALAESVAPLIPFLSKDALASIQIPGEAEIFSA